MSVLFHELEKGVMLPTEDGLLLCSARYHEEAASWAKNHETSEAEVVVVGLGAGFHIEALLARCPQLRITVVDCRPALKRFFENRSFNGQERVEVVVIDSVDGLYQHEIMETIAEKQLLTFAFKPCFGSRQKLFSELFRGLTGRSLRALQFFLPRMGFHGDWAKHVTEEGRLLNIRDLGLVIDGFHEGHPKAPAVRVLRELIV